MQIKSWKTLQCDSMSEKEIKQRKVLRYKGYTIKLVSYTERSMEWLIVASNNPPKRINDPTCCEYSISFMSFWLSYAKDEIECLIRTIELEKDKKSPLLLRINGPDLTFINRFTGEERYIIKHVSKVSTLNKDLRPRFRKEHSLYLRDLGLG